MIIYNVTINVEPEIHDEWFLWMKQTHIPDVLQTGMFSGHKMLKLLNEEPNNTGTTYAVQYYCKDLDDLQRYLEQYAPALRQDSQNKFEGKFVAFRTFLEEV